MVVIDPRQRVRVPSSAAHGAVYELRPLTSRHVMHVHELGSALNGASEIAKGLRLSEERLRLALVGWNVTDAEGRPAEIPTEDASILGEPTRVATLTFVREIPFADGIALGKALALMETIPSDVAQGFT